MAHLHYWARFLLRFALLLVQQTRFVVVAQTLKPNLPVVNILYISTDLREYYMPAASTYHIPSGNTDTPGMDLTSPSTQPPAVPWIGNAGLQYVQAMVHTRATMFYAKVGGGPSTSIRLILSEFGLVLDGPSSKSSSPRIHAIAGAATSPDLTSRSNYPMFFRTVPSDADGPPVLLQTLAQMGYTEVNGLYFEDSSIQAFQASFDQLLGTDSRFSQGPEYIFYAKSDVHPNPLLLYTNAAQGVKSGALTGTVDTRGLGQTYVWLAVANNQALPMYQLFCALSKAGVAGSTNQGFLFGAAESVDGAWWDPPSDPTTDLLYGASCTSADIRSVLLGTIHVAQANSDFNNTLSDKVNLKPTDFYQGLNLEFQRNGKGAHQVYPFHTYQFDSITAAVLALEYAQSKLPVQLDTFSYTGTNDQLISQKVMEYLQTQTFQGLTGSIQFNSATGGRALEFYEAKQFQTSTWQENKLVRIGTITVTNGAFTYTKDQPEVYPTSDGKPPLQATPKSYALAIALGVIGGVIFLFGVPLAAWLIKRHLNKIALDAALKNAKNWFLESEELKLESADTGLGASKGGSMASMHSAGAAKGAKSTTTQNSSEKLKGFRPYATYTHNQQRVCAFPLRRKSTALDRELVELMMNIQACASDNVARFVGVSVLEPSGGDEPTMHSLMGGSNKGSLADFLAQHKASGETLDDAFTFSLARDLHKGLADVHRILTFHGRLSSTVCMVDNRMSLRVSDYGFSPYRMPPFYDPITVTNQEAWLWCAPEVLRPLMEAVQKSTWFGTSGAVLGYPSLQPAEWARADMFSFGLICSEIFSVDKLYAEELGEDAEVLDFLKKIADQPSKASGFVRTSLANKSVAADVTDMVLKCVSAEPMERLTITDVTTLLRSMVKQRKLSSNLTEMLMQQLESYAANLEGIVAQRTEALAAEENKVKKLLHQILPPSVADALKNGETVPPQTFESVTIYFSDVVGFTVISAQSSALQIIDLLNDLYNAFDGILSTFDVYKVETIGDAYMVVSGLPQPNGKQHVRNIGLMSLGLIDHVLTKFKIRHRPDDQLRLRIGMHSGGCAAGVVGFVMPRYCLFGDTVNTASRMESTGEPLRIHVSESSSNIIKDLGLDKGPDAEFTLTPRGEIEVKGKGPMRTFWLTKPGDPIPTAVPGPTPGVH